MTPAGATADSRALAGNGPTVRSWMLSARTDANGNSVVYAYGAAGGSPIVSGS